MSDLSIFVDESGGQNGHSRYYVLTLVFHDQREDIEAVLEEHRRSLGIRGLVDIPFHAGPLMTGHGDYENMDFKTRKTYFSVFFMDLQHLPIRYKSFIYRRSELGDKGDFVARMRRDIVNLMFDRLAYFQSFDNVKIYYDDGQEIVARALHSAAEYALSKIGLMYRKTHATDFILAQAADMLCTLELTAHKFASKKMTRTDVKMFGSARSFKNNYMKAVRRKRLESGRPH